MPTGACSTSEAAVNHKLAFFDGNSFGKVVDGAPRGELPIVFILRSRSFRQISFGGNTNHESRFSTPTARY